MGWRRTGALSAFVLYAAMLLLAALPRPVRPHILDVPHLMADAVLRRFAIRGGISVFLPPAERVVDVLRNDCIVVRGLRNGTAPEFLQPPDGRCITSGVRIGVPQVEWMVRSILTGGEASLVEIQRQAVVGDFFCFAPPWRERRFDEVDLAWTQPAFDIDTGEERTTNLLYFRWRCAPPDLVTDLRAPSDEALRRVMDGR